VRSDPRQPRLLTWASLRWIVRHRAWSPFYLVRYWRMIKVRVCQPHIVMHGLVFLGKGVRLEAREGFGRLEIGRFVHIGDNTRVRCHEGSLRIGDKSVFGNENTINCYLDIEFGEAALVADWVYICDFDHVTDDIHRPIKDQGIAKSPVRIGPDTWICTKVTVTKGTRIGRGCVLGAHAVIRGDIPDYAVAAGIPARVVRDRREAYEADAARREAIADMGRKAERALREKLGSTG
jgi:acetyltransferase-like isoleucine patch superfamily enzyme